MPSPDHNGTTYYEFIGVSANADADEIERGIKIAKRDFHPDRGGSLEAFTRVEQAEKVLTGPRRRGRYDEFLSRFGDADGHRYYQLWIDKGRPESPNEWTPPAEETSSKPDANTSKGSATSTADQDTTSDASSETTSEDQSDSGADRDAGAGRDDRSSNTSTGTGRNDRSGDTDTDAGRTGTGSDAGRTGTGTGRAGATGSTDSGQTASTGNSNQNSAVNRSIPRPSLADFGSAVRAEFVRLFSVTAVAFSTVLLSPIWAIGVMLFIVILILGFGLVGGVITLLLWPFGVSVPLESLTVYLVTLSMVIAGLYAAFYGCAAFPAFYDPPYESLDKLPSLSTLIPWILPLVLTGSGLYLLYEQNLAYNTLTRIAIGSTALVLASAVINMKFLDIKLLLYDRYRGSSRNTSIEGPEFLVTFGLFASVYLFLNALLDIGIFVLSKLPVVGGWEQDWPGFIFPYAILALLDPILGSDNNSEEDFSDEIIFFDPATGEGLVEAGLIIFVLIPTTILILEIVITFLIYKFRS